MIEAALAGQREEAKIIGDVVKHCARAGSAKAGAHDHAEDVEQQLWMFLMRHSDRLNEEYNLEPYLVRTARNIAMAHARKFGMYGTEGEDARGDTEVDIDGRPTEIGGIDRINDMLDRQSAMKEILKTHPNLGRKKPASHTAKDLSMKQKNKNKLSADQEELRELRLKYGFTQTLMAARLGLKLPTYQAYEYGRTKGVPKRVAEEARKLQADPMYSSIENKYQGMSMREVAEAWSKRIGIAGNNPKKLAMALGINKSSTSRWLSGGCDVKLTTTELVIYERRVEVEEAYKNARADAGGKRARA